MSKHIREHIVLVGAGKIVRLSGLDADFVTAYQTPADVKFAINSETSFVWLAQGITYQRGPAEPIQHIVLRNDGSAEASVKLITGVGALVDSRGPVFGTTTQAKPSRFTSSAHVAIAATDSEELVAADSDRVAVILSNLEANGSVIYYGDSGIGSGEGAELPVGASVSLPTTATVYGYNPSGATVNIGVSEVFD